MRHIRATSLDLSITLHSGLDFVISQHFRSQLRISIAGQCFTLGLFFLVLNEVFFMFDIIIYTNPLAVPFRDLVLYVIFDYLPSSFSEPHYSKLVLQKRPNRTMFWTL